MKMKQIPNIITGIRIICAFALLFLEPLSWSFLAVYVIGGISDIADGFIARKRNVTSKTGTVLDSIADAFFIFILLFIFLPYFQWPGWFFGWVLAIIILRFTSLFVGALKYHTLAFLHTYANKATGLALFGFPVIFWICGLNTTALLLCCIATVSTLAEILFHRLSKKVDRNISTIFKIKKS